MFRALIILTISPSMKSKYLGLACVKNNWLVGSILLFFKGVHWLAKNLKIFAFAYISVTNLSSIKRGGIRGTFLSL